MSAIDLETTDTVLEPVELPIAQDGEEEQPSALAASIPSTSPDHSAPQSPTLYFKLLCPLSITGLIIGRGGTIINQLNNTSGAKIRLSQNHEYYPGTQDRVLLLKGDRDGISNALAELVTRIAEAPEKKNSSSSLDHHGNPIPQSNRGSNGTYVIKVLIPKLASAAIIGKGGSVIKRMSEQSGARYQLGDETDSFHTKERIVTISSLAVDSLVLGAQHLMNQLFDEAKVRSYANLSTNYSSNSNHLGQISTSTSSDVSPCTSTRSNKSETVGPVVDNSSNGNGSVNSGGNGYNHNRVHGASNVHSPTHHQGQSMHTSKSAAQQRTAFTGHGNPVSAHQNMQGGNMNQVGHQPMPQYLQQMQHQHQLMTGDASNSQHLAMGAGHVAGPRPEFLMTPGPVPHMQPYMGQSYLPQMHMIHGASMPNVPGQHIPPHYVYMQHPQQYPMMAPGQGFSPYDAVAYQQLPPPEMGMMLPQNALPSVTGQHVSYMSNVPRNFAPHQQQMMSGQQQSPQAQKSPSSQHQQQPHQAPQSQQQGALHQQPNPYSHLQQQQSQQQPTQSAHVQPMPGSVHGHMPSAHQQMMMSRYSVPQSNLNGFPVHSNPPSIQK